MEYYIKHDIFISYRHKDFQLAKDIHAYIEKMNYDIFWDVDLNSESLPNNEFPPVIEENVKNCKDFILVITVNTFDKERIFNEDDWIYRELKIALETKRNIIALLVDNIKFPTEDDLPPALKSLVREKQIYRFPIDLNLHIKEDIYRDLNKKLKSNPWITDYQVLMVDSKSYDSSLTAEENRLRIQADNTRFMDEEVLSKIKAENPDRRFTVLDVGCALGFVARSRFLDDCFSKVVEIDRNEKCIKDALKYTQDKPEFRKFKYNVCDIESDRFDLDIQSIMQNLDIDKFDLIFASQVLNHLREPVKCLQKLRKYMANNSYIVIRNSDDGAKIAGLKEDYKLVKDIVHLTYAIPGIADRNSGRRIFGWLQKCGFRDIEIKSFMRSTDNMEWDDRMRLFHESFEWRRELLGEESYKHSKNCVDMNEKLNELAQRFPDPSFWYCEFDFIGIGRTNGGKHYV